MVSSAAHDLTKDLRNNVKQITTNKIIRVLYKTHKTHMFCHEELWQAICMACNVWGAWLVLLQVSHLRPAELSTRRVGDNEDGPGAKRPKTK